MPELNRFEWFKAVLQLSELSASTKNVAAALAVEFANDKSGKICPSRETLAEYLGLSIATIKRAIKELVSLGWLHRTEGRGAGNCTRYYLRSPCKIIQFYQRKKGSPLSFQGQKKGSTLKEKGVTVEPSYKEQYFEQESCDGQDACDGKPLNPPSQASAQVFVPRISWGAKCWREFCEEMFGRSLDRLVKEAEAEGLPGYYLPKSQPPVQRAHWPAFHAALLSQGFGVSETRVAA